MILMANQTMADLKSNFPHQGKLEWIGISTAVRSDIKSINAIKLIANSGLEGDHHAKRSGGSRQVTLIQAEHLPVISALCQRNVTAELLRRNLVISGLNLIALKNSQFKIGDAILEGTGQCHPCSRMEEILGQGGFNAVRGHGGITAKVLFGGTIRIGDLFTVFSEK